MPLAQRCADSLGGPSVRLILTKRSIYVSEPQASAQCCVRRCKAIPGLEVAAEPEGSMRLASDFWSICGGSRYLMVRLQPGVLDIDSDDVRFAGKLLEEEPLESRRYG